MAFYVVFLECRRFVSIKEDWIQNPIVGQESKIFISQNNSSAPDFTLETSFYMRKDDACYNGFVYRNFGKKLFEKRCNKTKCESVDYTIFRQPNDI